MNIAIYFKGELIEQIEMRGLMTIDQKLHYWKKKYGKAYDHPEVVVKVNKHGKDKIIKGANVLTIQAIRQVQTEPKPIFKRPPAEYSNKKY